MAEASLNLPLKNTTDNKRKNEQFSKVMNAMMITEQNAEGARDFGQPSADLGKPCSVIPSKH